jgi:hypothetical protein
MHVIAIYAIYAHAIISRYAAAAAVVVVIV